MFFYSRNKHRQTFRKTRTNFGQSFRTAGADRRRNIILAGTRRDRSNTVKYYNVNIRVFAKLIRYCLLDAAVIARARIADRYAPVASIRKPDRDDSQRPVLASSSGPLTDRSPDRSGTTSVVYLRVN